jgi:hypothetical protein
VHELHAMHRYTRIQDPCISSATGYKIKQETLAFVRNEMEVMRNARIRAEQRKEKRKKATKPPFDFFPHFRKMQKCFEGIMTHDIPDCLVILNASHSSE